MRTFFKWLFATAGILIVGFVLVMGFAIWGSYETGKRLDIGYGTSTSPRLVRLEIGDKVFAIPQNHIWSREDWKGGKALGVNLYALLPNFEARTKANGPEFDRGGWGREISFLLSARGVPGSRSASTGSMSRRENYTTMVARVFVNKEVQGHFGLVKQVFEPNPPWFPTGKEVYTAKLPDGRFYWVTCYPDAPKTFPSCKSEILYSKHTYVSYTFGKPHLSDWQSIDVGMLNLIKQFENNAKKQGVQLIQYQDESIKGR